MRAILTYHSIDGSGSTVSTPPERFREQMEWIAGEGLTVTDVPGLLELPPECDAVALTFDDGFRNFATEAWPVLRNLGFPATVFVVVDQVGGTSRWESDGEDTPVLPLMDWDTLAELAAAGIRIGSHGRTHRALPELPLSELRREMVESAELLGKRLGTSPDGFAYPYGRFGRRAREAARSRYRWAVGTELRPLPGEPPLHALPRLDAYYFREPGTLEDWGSRGFDGRLWVRRQGRRLRHVLSGGSRVGSR